VLDNGMYKVWFARNYRTCVANTLLLDNALATMGAGLPPAMMAKLLYPQRRVMAVCGRWRLHDEQPGGDDRSAWA
jgi:acetolactate synthase I/II/III large subunit